MNGHRVLIIDDDSNTRTLLRLLLEHRGYQVALAPDGELGIELAHAQPPEIILLDVAMPRISGYDVYRELQASAETARIPLFVLSAALTTREMEHWRNQPGVLDVIPKPFDIYVLTGRIDDFFSRAAGA